MNSNDLGENYNKIAEWWTNTQMQKPEYGMEYIRKAIRYAKNKSEVLDIGCGGTGRVIDELLKHDFEITGIDVSSEMIRLVQAKYPDISFLNEDFIEWDTKEHFDLIIAWDSIFHAPISLQKKVTIKMCDLLNPGGVLLFTGGSYSGEASGKMEGVLLEYGTIGYRRYLDIVEEMKCKIILMEEDQYPAGHMVFIRQKN
ncbi:class I SAM-dependent methyltransferase [Thermodesulfobacteriota bacterium]